MTGNGILELTQKRQARLASVKKYGAQTGGFNQYVGILEGKKTHLRGSVAAYCYDCQGWFADGRCACLDPLCPLFPWAPFTHTRAPVDPTKHWNFQQKKEGA